MREEETEMWTTWRIRRNVVVEIHPSPPIAFDNGCSGKPKMAFFGLPLWMGMTLRSVLLMLLKISKRFLCRTFPWDHDFDEDPEEVEPATEETTKKRHPQWNVATIHWKGTGIPPNDPKRR
jgi:hypothetical protein